MMTTKVTNIKPKPGADPKDPFNLNKNDTTFISNSDPGANIEAMFDYGSITPRDKKLVQEIIKLIREQSEKGPDVVVSSLEEKFEIDPTPWMSVKDTLWYELTKDEPIQPNIQGFRLSKDKDGNSIKIPHIVFSSDLDYLDTFIQKIVWNYGKYMSEKNDVKT